MSINANNIDQGEPELNGHDAQLPDENQERERDELAHLANLKEMDWLRSPEGIAAMEDLF